MNPILVCAALLLGPLVPEVVQDLRQPYILGPGFKFVGPVAYTVPEKNGLRVTMPAKREKLLPVGLRTTFPLAGDFEIIGSFEFLSADTPSDPNGSAGVGLYVKLAPEGQLAWFGRCNTPKGQAYVVEHSGIEQAVQVFPSQQQSGQLKMVRRNDELSCFISDDSTQGQFKEITKFHFGTDDVVTTRFAVDTANEARAVDARLIDLRVRSPSVPMRVIDKEAPAPNPVAGELKSGALAEYRPSFAGKMPAGWERFGPEADQWVQLEPDGLRIALPAGRIMRQGVGVTSPLFLDGDFEIAVAFEILHEPEPADAGEPHTRLSLEVLLDKVKPARNMASISRVAHLTGTDFNAWAVLNDDAIEPSERIFRERLQAMAKKGRLCLRRVGADLSFLVAEDDEKDFTLLQRIPFGAESLREVRLVAATGGPNAAIDVRFRDLCIRGNSPPGMPETGPNSSWRIYVVLATAGVLVLASGLAWRRRLLARRKATLAASAGALLSCSACGATRRARGNIAGKTIRCPQCGGLMAGRR